MGAPTELTQEVLFESENGIAIITMNRPAQRNALNQGLRTGLRMAWELFGG